MIRRRSELTELPEDFCSAYAPLVSDSEALFDILLSPLAPSFRVNTLKSSAGEIKERFAGYGIRIVQTPWYEDAFVSPEVDPSPTLEHFLGKIYLQELASMAPPLVVRGEIRQAALVLDTCAAPGSKTTQLAALMDNRAAIIANDIDYQRIRALKFNLNRDGVYNTVITHSNINAFTENTLDFDVILVDAPCSSDGTVRKSPGLLSGWRAGRAHKYARYQRHLLKKAYRLLKPGGVIVYSTCSLSPVENELVVNALLEEHPARVEPFDIPNLRLRPGITSWESTELAPQVQDTRRLWPQDNDTDGFFLARIRKPETQ
ncbi:MAG: NOL1/NOP2/sun family putative RNA methylase [Candidatus Zixiibacteriota bacterium]